LTIAISNRCGEDLKSRIAGFLASIEIENQAMDEG
jgi:hypothetical protein